MSHWAMKYIGQEWTAEHNCYYWFRRIMSEQFGRDGLPPDVVVNEKIAARIAMRELKDDAVLQYGWTRTDNPVEGDAVLLTEGKRSSHIGVVTFSKDKMLVIHACRKTGVVLSDSLSLKVNNLRITGCWTYENIL